jgi:hypothetical protein
MIVSDVKHDAQKLSRELPSWIDQERAMAVAMFKVSIRIKIFSGSARW